MKLLTIDTETTGLSETDQVCEIAATLYNASSNPRETGAIASISCLLPMSVPNEAEAINGISIELAQHGKDFAIQSIVILKQMAATADYCVAFNAEFDAPRINQLIGVQKWLCAMNDFDWGFPKKGSYKLIDLALCLGIGISTAHRAGDDVRLLVECMNRRREVLPEMLELAIIRANSPIFELEALVSYNDRELAKNAGFKWDALNKRWIKKVKECDYQKMLESINFQVSIRTINNSDNHVTFLGDGK